MDCHVAMLLAMTSFIRYALSFINVLYSRSLLPDESDGVKEENHRFTSLPTRRVSFWPARRASSGGRTTSSVFDMIGIAPQDLTPAATRSGFRCGNPPW
jgi:hypothetical protein